MPCRVPLAELESTKAVKRSELPEVRDVMYNGARPCCSLAPPHPLITYPQGEDQDMLGKPEESTFSERSASYRNAPLPAVSRYPDRERFEGQHQCRGSMRSVSCPVPCGRSGFALPSQPVLGWK